MHPSAAKDGNEAERVEAAPTKFEDGAVDLRYSWALYQGWPGTMVGLQCVTAT